MQNLESRALAFAVEFGESYFERRDYEKLPMLLDDDILLIGTGENEYLRGISEFEAMLCAEQKGARKLFHILSRELSADAITDSCCTVAGFVEVAEEDAANNMTPLRIRVSAILREREGAIRLWRLHVSVGEDARNAGNHFPATISENGDKNLRRMLNDRSAALYTRNAELKALNNNIPGGVFCCRNDEKFTLLQLSGGFLEMFGYLRKEISELFHDSFLAMLHPDDREMMLSALREQTESGQTFRLEYRMLCKNGSTMWVQDRSQFVTSEEDGETIYCVLLDITQEKRDREELRMSLERHRIIMNQTRDIIFEWDIVKDTLVFSDNWGEKFGYTPITRDISDGILLLGHLHRDDIRCFKELRQKLLDGSAFAQTEFRIQKNDGSYIWCRARATGQYDTNGNPAKAIGVILDIDAEKRLFTRLQEKAERDALTGLYNKMTAQTLIEHALFASDADGRDALMILDVDNFKLVNDQFGHLTGDALLTDVSGGLKKMFRSTDVIGRVGGDEFVVFLRNIPSEQFALDQAEKIVNLFRDLFNGGIEDLNISCSVGIAISSAGENEFQRLYDNADVALYKAKSQGKNQFILFDMTRDFGRSYAGAVSAVSGSIDSDIGNRSETDRMVSYVLHTLYESGDTAEAVSAMLELVGRQFNVSRVYIIEDSEDGASCSNTFEWCNDGVTPAKDRLQNIAYADLGEDYYAHFNESGIFYCQDVSHLSTEVSTLVGSQQIKAMLQCALRDNGRNRGFVGFDECDTQRFWTKEQIDALILISEILCIFLLKQRARERISKTAEQLRSLLDSQNAWIYAIDKNSYELLYVNQKTRSLGLPIYPGARCHKVFFGRDIPCEICPRNNMVAGELYSTEVYNPLLRVWTLADVTALKWDNLDAYLVTCYDITNYKTDPPAEQ